MIHKAKKKLASTVVPLDHQELTTEQKYQYYEQSVQNPEGEVEVLMQITREQLGQEAITLREDFAGTAALCAAWVKTHAQRRAYGVDLDPMPLAYGQKHHLQGKLNAAQQQRVHLIQGNVLDVEQAPVDVIVALNFSYFIFKSRHQLLDYFSKTRRRLNKRGVFVIDLFGGFDAHKVMEERTDLGNITYYWDCLSFNPLDHHGHFAIHFKNKKKKYRNVFTYDWRLWSMPELRDLLLDAGFAKVVPYWEGDDEEGGGNGEFSAQMQSENCHSWVSYLVGVV